MAGTRTEVVWFEARTGYSCDELVDLSGLPREALDALVAAGVLDVDASARAPAQFSTEQVTLARAARRLREHFELDDNGLAVALALLRRVRGLEARLATLHEGETGS
jgi:chaperone modulatory protein CbpM